jgi:large exoprotein involved in heme utilization and adhesion
VSASESVELVGVGSFPDGGFFPSGLFAQVEKEATGERGTLTIETRQLNVRDGAEVSTTTLGAGRGVDLVVRASESVELEGTSPDGGFPSGLFAQVDVNQFGDEATGKGGTLTIETRQLNVRDGAQVATTSFSSGSAGDLRVSALDSVELVGTAPDKITPSGLFAQVEQEATDDAGNLAIETGRLTVLNGAQISSSTKGKGQGGTLTINASDSIQLSGASPAATLTVGRSGIFVSGEPGATGNVGALNISTGQLTVENEAEISANNSGTAKGGTATLNTRQLIIRDGGWVGAGSRGEGPGGTLTVNATESVQVAGTGTVGSDQVASTLFTQANSSGKAGDLNITTRSLNVRDGARVSVSGEGTGPAGNLTIKANSIRLNQGRLTAETQARSGANINLQDLDLLLMRDRSLVSARAFNEANGGDVTIRADNGFIVAVPGEDSDIIANASEGRGGNIQITTQGIFGIEERRAIPGNGTNDIDASSQFGVNGVVVINTPDFDPSQGLVNLPNEPVNVEVAQGCQTGKEQASVAFFNTGRGGLAPNPYEPISSSEIWEDVQLPKQRAENPAAASRASTSPATPPNKIVEAQGWLYNEKGEVVLVAQMPTTRPQGRCRLR